MRLLGGGLGALVVSFGLALGCGESEGKGGAAAGGGESSAGQTAGGNLPSAGDSHGGAAASAGGPMGGSSDGSDSSRGGGGSAGLVPCDAKQVLCRVARPRCEAGQVPSVSGMCWGECVEVERCACSDAQQCPEPERYTCWMKSHCGPFVD